MNNRLPKVPFFSIIVPCCDVEPYVKSVADAMKNRYGEKNVITVSAGDVFSGGSAVDVYAKYLYNRRNGISFDTGGADYNLDAVTSSVLRVGARYTMKREAWNFYGGLAYEYEMDGEAKGKVGGLAIRAADIGGGSVRAELGATMTPDNSPWSLDLNLTGFAGKKRGLSGGVSVAFMF